jgi:segregation and condensation protein B
MKNLQSKLESILFVAGKPIKAVDLARAIGAEPDEVREALRHLTAQNHERGINLIEKEDRYQLITNPENAKTVADFLNAEIREKLTDASLETLGIILYKQPVSRAEIEAIRGVNSQYILRQLLIRGLIEKTPHPEDQRRLVYKTTLEFMQHLGIRDMKELPDFEELTRSITLPEVTAEAETDGEKKPEIMTENL